MASESPFAVPRWVNVKSSADYIRQGKTAAEQVDTHKTSVAFCKVPKVAAEYAWPSWSSPVGESCGLDRSRYCRCKVRLLPMFRGTNELPLTTIPCGSHIDSCHQPPRPQMTCRRNHGVTSLKFREDHRCFPFIFFSLSSFSGRSVTTALVRRHASAARAYSRRINPHRLTGTIDDRDSQKVPIDRNI